MLAFQFYYKISFRATEENKQNMYLIIYVHFATSDLCKHVNYNIYYHIFTV